MTKMETYEAVCEFGQDASFLANVILNWHSKPARKLNGALKLLRSGAEIRTGQFAIDVLVINGERACWSTLETV